MQSPADVLIFAREARRAGTERHLVSRAGRGELVRMRPGVYVRADHWAGLDGDAKYRLRVCAAAAALPPTTQFSHDSAAALWRLPTLGPWSTRIHVLGAPVTGGRSSPGLIRHGIGFDYVPSLLAGAMVSSLARTVVDIAMTATFARAVGMADDALRPPEQGDFRFGSEPVSREELLALLDARAQHRGATKARRAIEFASGLSGSLGESVSRVTLQLIGVPAPLQQVPFYDAAGLIGYADFYWPELDLIGEFDGRVKYRGQVYLRGRLPEEVVWAEKQREDRLRRVTHGVIRWDWDTARTPRALAARIAPFGLLP